MRKFRHKTEWRKTTFVGRFELVHRDTRAVVATAEVEQKRVAVRISFAAAVPWAGSVWRFPDRLRGQRMVEANLENFFPNRGY